jgi:hypothetical protein
MVLHGVTWTIGEDLVLTSNIWDSKWSMLYGPILGS